MSQYQTETRLSTIQGSATTPRHRKQCYCARSCTHYYDKEILYTIHNKLTFLGNNLFFLLITASHYCIISRHMQLPWDMVYATYEVWQTTCYRQSNWVTICDRSNCNLKPTEDTTAQGGEVQLCQVRVQFTRESWLEPHSPPLHQTHKISRFVWSKW